MLLLFFILSKTPVYAQIQSELATQSLFKADSKNIHIEKLFFQALALKYKGEFEKAKNILSQILELDSQADAIYYELAEVEISTVNNLILDSEKIKKTWSYLSEALRIRPQNMSYLERFKEVSVLQNDFYSAFVTLKTLTILNPKKENYYYERIDLLLKEQKYESALKIVEDFIKMMGETTKIMLIKIDILFALGRIEEGFTELEKLIRYEPYEPKNHIVYIRVLNSIAENEEVIKKMNVAIVNAYNNFPTSKELLLTIFNVYGQRMYSEIAFDYLKCLMHLSSGISYEEKFNILLQNIPHYNQKIELVRWNEVLDILKKYRKDDPNIYLIKGDLLKEQDKFVEAEKMYRLSLDFDKNNFNAWFNYLMMKSISGDFSGMEKVAREALIYYPSQSWFYYFLGIAQLRLYKDKNYAVESLKNSIAFGIDNKNILSLAYSFLGESYHEMKEYKLSDETMEKSLELDPDNATTLNNYAYFLSVRNENLDKAYKMSLKSIELQPNMTSFEDTIAWILFRKKKYRKALKWIEKAVESDKEQSAVLLEHYADILFHLGEKQKALKIWRKASKLDTSNDLIKKKIELEKFIE